MTEPTPAPEHTLMLSERDAQWLTAIVAFITSVFHLMHSGQDFSIRYNMDSLFDVYEELYSSDEANALADRIYALLPEGSPVRVQRVPRGLPMVLPQSNQIQ